MQNDWDLTKFRTYLLWDKLDLPEAYGIGNDDRLWYCIAFIEIYKINPEKNQHFLSLAIEVYDFI